MSQPPRPRFSLFELLCHSMMGAALGILCAGLLLTVGTQLADGVSPLRALLAQPASPLATFDFLLTVGLGFGLGATFTGAVFLAGERAFGPGEANPLWLERNGAPRVARVKTESTRRPIVARNDGPARDRTGPGWEIGVAVMVVAVILMAWAWGNHGGWGWGEPHRSAYLAPPPNSSANTPASRKGIEVPSPGTGTPAH